jgi:ribosomal 50S subunit-associated protein YjgA (DUF615 family)
MVEDFQEKPSKSALKRAHQVRQKQAEMLCKLSAEKFRRLQLPERISDELAVARGMKPSSAKNRQIRFISTLMTDMDEEEIARLETALARN